MVEEGVIIESLPDRPLRKRERNVLEQHDRIQMVMSSQMRFDSEFGEIMDGAMLIGEDWVTAIRYEEDRGWKVIYQSDMENNILEDGFLRSEDLHEDHPIQEGMDALNGVSLPGDEQYRESVE